MIKYIDYDDGLLDTEINNYLFFLNEVCLNRKDVRRYVSSVLRLYEKLNSLSVDYSNEDLNSNRTLRKSSRYINKIKKLVKKIKNVDSSVFKEAADRLYEKNGDIDGIYKNRYCKDGWDSEKISRTLSGDISGVIKRKRKKVLSSTQTSLSDSSEAIYFDDFDTNNNEKEILEDNNEKDILKDENNEKKFTQNNDDEKENESISNYEDNNISQKEKISLNDDYYFSSNSSDYVERTLVKKELVELKKEIDQNEDLFIDISHINFEQKRVIKSYMSICNKYNDIDKLFHFVYDNSTSSDIVNIYKKIYDFVGFLISEMFEHIIHLSKISCDINSENGMYEEKYLMDSSVIDVFGKYDLFIAKIQNYVKLLNEKQGKNLSSSDKKMLSKILWDKYRLDDINPSSIKEAVSLDLMSFVNKNPFTLVQTISSSKRKNEPYKKYDLDKILENTDYGLEKYIPELFKSIKNKISHDSLLSNYDKEYAISNIIKSFSNYIGEIHGLSEYPDVSYDYLISYIMYKVFSVSDNLDGMLKECINEIYIEEQEKYKSLGFFEKLMYSKGKPNVSIIEDKIKAFTQKIDNISFSTE
ncbi:MAG: hypothetical protein IKF91_06040 [Bacilli bacterium]|nr:hypothetical protein [Bacilli bacterium]